jgi:hypothetical protein
MKGESTMESEGVLTKEYARETEAELFVLHSKLIACIDDFNKRHGFNADTVIERENGKTFRMAITITDNNAQSSVKRND